MITSHVNRDTFTFAFLSSGQTNWHKLHIGSSELLYTVYVPSLSPSLPSFSLSPPLWFFLGCWRSNRCMCLLNTSFVYCSWNLWPLCCFVGLRKLEEKWMMNMLSLSGGWTLPGMLHSLLFFAMKLYSFTGDFWFSEVISCCDWKITNMAKGSLNSFFCLKF